MKYILTITLYSFLLLDTQEAKAQEEFWDESIIHKIHLEISNEEWKAMQPDHQRDVNNNNEDLKAKDENKGNCIAHVFHGRKLRLLLMGQGLMILESVTKETLVSTLCMVV